MTPDSLPKEICWAVEAAQNKLAADVTVLDLTGLGAFTDYFLLCSGASAPQIEAIGREIEGQLERRGVRLEHREGRAGTEWLLLDFSSFIVHILSGKARLFYDIERLWRSAPRWDVPAPERPQAPAAGQP